MRPLFTYRYKLISALIVYIQGFHRVGQLHKSMTSFIIICFLNIFLSIPDFLIAPYFIRFDYSRINKNCIFSLLLGLEKLYQYLVYRRNAEAYIDNKENSIQRFRQEFDYYSVGMMFIKIAFQKPLKLIIDSTGIVGSSEKILKKLLKESVPQVRVYIRNIYETIIKYNFTTYKNRQGSLKNIRKGFYKNTVLPLSRCVV